MSRPETPALAGCVAVEDRPDAWELALSGRLDLDRVQMEAKALACLTPPFDPKSGAARPVRIGLDKLEAIDTAGAVAIRQLDQRLRLAGYRVEVTGMPATFQPLLETVYTECDRAPSAPPVLTGFLRLVEQIGASTVSVLQEAREIIAFLGLMVAALGRGLRQPRRLRLLPIAAHIEAIGVNALPIVGLLSFLIGIVIAYQGAQQLRQFGADILVVNMLAIGITRELGVLMTAIMVAGRSGSAFTAQIGTMKVNQEIDAMRTIGLDPSDFLILPRLIAMVIVMPLLAFYASVMGLAGGALMTWITLDITPAQFLSQLSLAITNASVFVGLVKAPVFGFVIALVGCYQGFQVGSSAESVGRRTTISVVHAIFLIIALDAGFSVFFATLDI